MRITVLQKFVVSGPLLFLFCGLCAAEVEKVQFRENKVWAWQNGTSAVTAEKVSLPFSIVVETNGAFTVNGGKERKLEEGSILGRDGMLLQPDGTITPVMDHVTLSRGRVVVTKDGDSSPLAETLQLGDGTKVSSDGKIIFADGTSRRLLDGELFQLGGGSLPTRDTIRMQNGRVLVQKDGSTLTIEPTRSITMNDGTKVFGDGTVIGFNGEEKKLVEGQVLVIEGVEARKRP